MVRKLVLIGVVLVVGLVFAMSAAAQGRRGQGGGGVIYVTSQGLYFDTFVAVDPLPFEGPFQQLEEGAGPNGLSQTAFGPGDPGYLGGRWWVDENGNGEMDAGDHYFLCPLLGPGRTSP
jgi:hypothetical protein